MKLFLSNGGENAALKLPNGLIKNLMFLSYCCSDDGYFQLEVRVGEV